MDSVEHGASSSSASDNATLLVQRVRPHRNHGAGVVVSGEGSDYRVDRTVWAAIGLAPGDVVDVEIMCDLAGRSAPAFCRSDAVALLARREHSQSELRRKLSQRTYDERTIAPVLATLVEERLLSDERFAEAYIRSRFRRGGESRTALLRGLAQRGVGDDVARAAVAAYETDNPGCFAAALDRALERLPARTRNDRARAVRMLSRRGYPVSDVTNRFP